ncbi:phospholipase-like protein [Tanacetum coccineum]
MINHVPKPPVIEHHPLFQAYLSKLEKSRKRLASSFKESSSVCTRDNRLKTRRLTDRVIRELNVRVFKLETIIQVLALERNDKLGFNEDLSRLRGDFVESLNILFQDLVDPHDSVEDIANKYLVDEELKLCLEEEERIRSEQEKRIQQEKRLRLEEEKMLRLEEEKMLQIAEDVSCLFHSMDTIWLSDDIERFISQPVQLKSMFPWSYDYTVSRNFWLRLVCLDPCRKGWLSEELYLLALSANSLLVKDMMVKLFETDNERDLRTVAGTYAMCQQFHVCCHERRDKMLKMQSFLHVSTSLAQSYKLLEELQDYELEKCRDLMKSISETQLKERLPVILEGAKVFDKKGIHPSDYTISFKLADNVPKQGGIYGDCGVWVCIFLYRLAHGLSLDVEDPVDVALAYREKMVQLI